MEWTKQKLAHYLGEVRTTVEFKGVTGKELTQIFEGEAMRRLKKVEEIVYNEYQSDEEKLLEIAKLVEEQQNPGHGR